MNSKLIYYILFTMTFIFGCKEEHKVYVDKIYEKPEIVKDPPSDFLSPEESMKTFYLPEGFKVELVASEPMIDEPVTFAWDGDGKMYVAEMNTYMQTIDADGRDESVSKIKLLIDTNGDGKIDKSTVFIDSLLLPRMILPLDDRLIVNETYSYDLWSYRDTDGDGVADEKKRVYYKPQPRGGNMEHQQSGLLWNLDNWTYTTYNPTRFKFKKDTVIADKLYDMPSGQWGLTQDDMGHMYYSAAGGENPAYGFQQPAVYGKYDPPGRLSEGFIEPWPIVGTPDVQGGAEKRLREDGTLNHFTGVAGQEIFTGHRLPSFMYGDLFIPEPVGRLVRRAKVKNENGKLVLYNAYDKAEFMASTDLNFRPIQAKTGPDGALYILDMYRGIIQESNWTKKGSKLRPVILRKGLDKNIGKGRIYRIVHEDIKPDKQPKLLSKSAKELLPYLGHINGWYRNTAQKLVILKEDLSVVPDLEQMASNNKKTNEGVLERIHALWTLEGLDALKKSLIIEKLKDDDKRVQIMAIRLSVDSLKAGEKNFVTLLKELSSKGDADLNNQIALSLRFSELKEASDLLLSIKDKFKDNDIIKHSANESMRKDNDDIHKLRTKVEHLDPKIQRQVFAGFDTYNQLCITCHGKDLKGTPNEDGSLNAPSLMGSVRVKGRTDIFAKILLNGLIGEVDGTDYGIMMSLKSNSDLWLSSVMSYVRVMNDEDPVHFQVVRKVREADKNRDDYWTLEELTKNK